MPLEPPRCPLATREKRWATALTRTLQRTRVSPNAVSVASLVFAVAAGVALGLSAGLTNIARAIALLAAAACIQLRLLCNMLDGMVAVEGGERTRLGELFNDMPDRFSDVAILAGAGYAIAGVLVGHPAGMACGDARSSTAYVRLLGGTMGVAQSFTGPMAKPHRMAVLTVACVLSAFEPLAGWRGANACDRPRCDRHRIVHHNRTAHRAHRNWRGRSMSLNPLGSLIALAARLIAGVQVTWTGGLPAQRQR